MPPHRKGKERGSLPSLVTPLVSVLTDGRSKSRHNREVVRLLRLLIGDGIRTFNMHHVRDGGLCRELPIALDGKYYDISYLSEDGELFLIEVMRVTNLGEGRFYPDTNRLGNGSDKQD